MHESTHLLQIQIFMSSHNSTTKYVHLNLANIFQVRNNSQTRGDTINYNMIFMNTESPGVSCTVYIVHHAIAMHA